MTHHFDSERERLSKEEKLEKQSKKFDIRELREENDMEKLSKKAEKEAKQAERAAKQERKSTKKERKAVKGKPKRNRGSLDAVSFHSDVQE